VLENKFVSNTDGLAFYHLKNVFPNILFGDTRKCLISDACRAPILWVCV